MLLAYGFIAAYVICMTFPTQASGLRLSRSTTRSTISLLQKRLQHLPLCMETNEAIRGGDYAGRPAPDTAGPFHPPRRKPSDYP